MARNLGNTDRFIRILAGTGMFFTGLVKTGGVGCVFSIIGLILVLTGLTGRCPLCSMLGINTCRIRPPVGN